tara:strand:+ start:6880 stop:7203 length:324 start_codon:yes stop_codon:yes gene_type:complete
MATTPHALFGLAASFVDASALDGLRLKMPFNDLVSGRGQPTVQQLLMVCKAADVELTLDDGAELKELESKINDLEGWGIALEDSIKDEKKKVKSLQAKVRRLEKKSS